MSALALFCVIVATSYAWGAYVQYRRWKAREADWLGRERLYRRTIDRQARELQSRPVIGFDPGYDPVQRAIEALMGRDTYQEKP